MVPAIPGILLSIGIIAALGLAVMENPQVQEWLDQQRRKIVELLTMAGNDLDPESRRAAEAFAYEGRTPEASTAQSDNTTAIALREAAAGLDAAAVATGRSSSNTSTVRRIPISGPTDPDAARERRLMGQAYLARREQQMFELQQRRSLASLPQTPATEAPPQPERTPSFDALVDSEGHLRNSDAAAEAHKPVTVDQLPEQIREEARQVERNLDLPLLANSAATTASNNSSNSGWQLGSAFANPFSDEYEMDRSITPRPPPAVPPKVALDHPVPVPDPEISVPVAETTATSSSAASRAQRQTEATSHVETSQHDDLSYEEQLAIALSLSEQESSYRNAANSQQQAQQSRPAHEDEDEQDAANLRAAIAASLRDMHPSQPSLDGQQAAHALAHAEASPASRNHQLIDLAESSAPFAPMPMRQMQQPHREWESLFATPPPPGAVRSPPFESEATGTRIGFAGGAYPAPPAPASVVSSLASDDLYRITPQLTRARLASLNASNAALAGAQAEQVPDNEALDSSFYSAVSLPTARSATIGRDAEADSVEQASLVDLSVNDDESLADGARTPTTTHAPQHSLGFFPAPATEIGAGAATSPPSVAPSVAPSQSETASSIAEVVDVDSDVDMMSEDGEGIATPDSWSEVGSREGDEDDVEDDVAAPHHGLTNSAARAAQEEDDDDDDAIDEHLHHNNLVGA